MGKGLKKQNRNRVNMLVLGVSLMISIGVLGLKSSLIKMDGEGFAFRSQVHNVLTVNAGLKIRSYQSLLKKLIRLV